MLKLCEVRPKGKSLCPRFRGGISVLIPTYQESQVLPDFLPALMKVLESVPWKSEVIIIDDNSPDDTAGLASKLAPNFRVPLRVIVRREKRRSLSASVLRGALSARFPFVAVMDADLTHDPKDLPNLIRPVLKGDVDVAVGSRCQGAEFHLNTTVLRSIISGMGISLARLFTHVRDPLSGFFVCRRSILVDLSRKVTPRGFKILLEVLARKRHLKVSEIPISFGPRKAGESKLGTRQILEFFQQLIELFFVRSCFIDRVRVSKTQVSVGKEEV